MFRFLKNSILVIFLVALSACQNQRQNSSINSNITPQMANIMIDGLTKQSQYFKDYLHDKINIDQLNSLNNNLQMCILYRNTEPKALIYCDSISMAVNATKANRGGKEEFIKSYEYFKSNLLAAEKDYDNKIAIKNRYDSISSSLDTASKLLGPQGQGSSYNSNSDSLNSNCQCKCVNGKVESLCKSPTSTPPICPIQICPITPPAVPPVPSTELPPIGSRFCKYDQVYDSGKGIYEWKNICR